jgi:hypothetical protein
MKRLIIVVAVFLGLATPALAQLPIEAGKQFTLAATHDGVNVDGFRVYVDGAQAAPDIPASAVVSGTVTSAPLAGLTPGSHTLQMSAFNAIGEVKSAPLLISAITLPTAPTGLKITLTVALAADGTPTITATTAEPIK